MPKALSNKKKEEEKDAVVDNKTGKEVDESDVARDDPTLKALFADANPNDPLRPIFAPLGKHDVVEKGQKAMYRKVNVPAHRFSPLKEHWMALYTPVTKQMKIDTKIRHVAKLDTKNQK